MQTDGEVRRLTHAYHFKQQSMAVRERENAQLKQQMIVQQQQQMVLQQKSARIAARKQQPQQQDEGEVTRLRQQVRGQQLKEQANSVRATRKQQQLDQCLEHLGDTYHYS